MVYTSVATSQMDQADVFNIVQTSVDNNMARGVTGFLIYADNKFCQLIEGEEDDLRGLLKTIGADPRHKAIEVLVDEPISARRFPRWRMQRVSKTSGSIDEIRQVLTSAPGGRGALRHVERFLA
jgi:hypothetical protein